MKIGVFDSGLGGLVIAKAIRESLPQYDFVYLGDTKRVPYGNRSEETIYEFTKEAVDYLFRKEKCAIIIIACNTISARALRKIQREYLPVHFPERRVLGVLIPAAEECMKFDKVGILATRSTVASGAFPKEIGKLSKPQIIKGSEKIEVFQNSAPMLVPLAEEGINEKVGPFIEQYLKPLLNKKIDALVLGCTHYPMFKEEIKKEIKKYNNTKVKIISQDEIIPKKLHSYLLRHKEINKKLSCKRSLKILVTKKTNVVKKLTGEWFEKITPKLIEL